MQKIEHTNKKAEFQFFLMDSYTCGMQLLGTEIKAIREGKVNLTDAFCIIINNEVYIKSLHIGEYSLGTYANHEPRRIRKLLLNKKEIKKIIVKLKEKGITLIPTKLYVNESGKAKLDISLAKGKKLFDKRETLKNKDIKKQLDRVRKSY